MTSRRALGAGLGRRTTVRVFETVDRPSSGPTPEPFGITTQAGEQITTQADNPLITQAGT